MYDDRVCKWFASERKRIMNFRKLFPEDEAVHKLLVNDHNKSFQFYERFTYSEALLCSHQRQYLSEIYSPVTVDTSNPLVVVSSFLPVINHQRESCCCGHSDSEMNAHRLEVQEKPDIIHIPSGGKAIVKSHHLSSSFEKNTFNKIAVNVIASNNYPETGIMEHRVEKDADTSPILNVSQEPARFQKYELDNTCSDLQTGAKYSISSQSCYLSASCLNLTKENLSYFSSSLNEEFKYVHEQQHNISSAVENTNGIEINTDSSYFKENESEYKCNYFDDDSQLEYHSTEEQDYVDCDCSYRQETENSEIFQENELVNEGSVTDNQQLLNKVEDTFSTSGCIVMDHYNCKEIATFPQMLQDVSCTENQYIHLDEKRNESLSMFYSIVEDSSHVNKEKNNSELFLTSKAEIEEKIKVNFLTDTALKSIMPTTKEMFKNIYLNKTGNPHILCQERILLPFPQVSHNPEGSNSCAYKPSVVVNADIENCVYNSCEHHGNCTENFSSAELKRITNMYHESGKNLRSAVNQATDATADFRASFTTSRAINVKSSVVSKAQNTVITMMNKCRPREWLGPEIMPVMADYRSVACNTDWSCISGNVEMIDSQIAISDILEDCITSDASKHGWKSNPEDPMEWSNSSSKDLNEIPYRMMQLSKEINHLPNCCKEMLQKAIKAEMQLLKLRYQMFHQHCWQTCRLFMKGKENICSSPLGTGKPLSETLSSQDNEVSSLHFITAQKNENSDPQQCLSKKNLEERKNSIEEKSSLNTQEISEEWFDATENPTTIESSVLCTDPLKWSATETQAIEEEKKGLKNNYCVHVGGLSPSISEVDLWLHFQKYNISEVSVCEYSENYRYAFLSFKTSCDAKLAVKEMNEREIKGKAMKVRLVRTVRENGIQDYQNCLKQKYENQRPLSKRRHKYWKNSDPILEVPARTSATFILPPDEPFSLKNSDVSKDELKSPFPVLPLANVPRLASGSSEVPSSDIVSSKSSSRKAPFEVDQEDIAEGLLPFGSVQFTPNPSSTFIPPNTLNLRSFRKVVKKLEELHPEISRDNILDALVEIKENKGQLSGLPLSTIVQMTSSLLNKKFASQSEKKESEK